MGTWKTEVQTIENNVSSFLNSGLNKVKDLFGSTIGGTIDQVTSLFQNGTTVVGINVNQIPSMKEAIRKYVDNLNQILAKLDAVDPSIAFKGVYAEAVTEYILSVKQACQSVISNMLAFNDQLTKVQEAYENKDTEMKTRLSSDAETTRSSFQNYAEGAK